MATRSATKKKSVAERVSGNRTRQIAAGEFKAKCLGVMREVASTGNPVLVTLRGKPLVEVIPRRNGGRKSKRADNFIGRLEGVMEIIGDPDDLIKPVFPLEDYDMLK